MTPDAFYRWTELDRTTWPELRDQILHFAPEEPHEEPRRYPGYPRFELDRVRARWWPSLDQALHSRRSVRDLGTTLPSRKTLSRLLHYAHGVHDSLGRGPTPSSGGLQSLELYLVNLASDWLPSGLYHYDRSGHFLSQIAADTKCDAWHAIIPSMMLVNGGVLLWILVGDGARIEKKYGARGQRFLLLEAGHLMQNLCLLATSLGLATVPLGGFFERDIARRFELPASDLVLHCGVCGTTQ